MSLAPPLGSPDPPANTPVTHWSHCPVGPSSPLWWQENGVGAVWPCGSRLPVLGPRKDALQGPFHPSHCGPH